MANIVVAIYNPLIRQQGMFPYFEVLIDSLKGAGNNVLCFQKKANDKYIKSTIPSKHLAKLKEFKPDLFIIVNNQFWDVSQYFDCPIIILDVDSTNAYANIESLIKNGRYKYLCITTQEIKVINEIIKCDKSNIRYLPPFSGICSEKKNQNINIAFCGSHWLWNDFNQIHNFLSKNPNDEEREIAKKVYNDFVKNPFYSADYFYEKYSEKVNNKLDFGDLFLYSTRVSGIKRLNILNAIESLGLEIRGYLWNEANATPLKAFPKLLLSHSDSIVNNLSTTQDFYNSAKIGFNTNHIQAQSGFSWRVCDILASNACLVTEDMQDLEKFGFPIATYSSDVEAHEICEKLLKNPNMRNDLVAQAHEIIDKKFRFNNVLSIIEDFSGVCLHTDMNGNLEIITTDIDSKNFTNCSNNVSGNVVGRELSFKNKMRYKIWHHLNKKLIKKGLITLNNSQLIAVKENPIPYICIKGKLNLKNKIRYKIWKHLTKKILKKGPLSKEYAKTYIKKVRYKVWKHLNKKLLKKGIIQQIGLTEFQKQEDLKKQLLAQLKKKYQNDKKIKVAFMVVFDSVFPAEPLFRKMLKDNMFDPYILVIPDMIRGQDNMMLTLDKTYATLSSKYSCVFLSYDKVNDEFIDYTRNMDIVCSANPYDDMTHKFYRISELTKNNVLSIYFQYGYPSVNWAREVAKLPSLSLSWKVYLESDTVLKEYEKYMASKGKNCVVSGYIKCDLLADQIVSNRKRKRIIIAPHHTINKNFYNVLGLSNFLRYADFFQNLPQLYPEIDFVFRPHPLLKKALYKDEVWGKIKTDKYFEDIQKNSNLIYQDGGDYFETFMNSDGIIHDCSSFLAEYLFTEKPICYMLRNKEAIKKYFMKNGEEMLRYCYQAFSEDEIMNFLNTVIIKENDVLYESRRKFVRDKMKINYPNVSSYVLQDIKNDIYSA